MDCVNLINQKSFFISTHNIRYYPFVSFDLKMLEIDTENLKIFF